MFLNTDTYHKKEKMKMMLYREKRKKICHFVTPKIYYAQLNDPAFYNLRKIRMLNNTDTQQKKEKMKMMLNREKRKNWSDYVRALVTNGHPRT